MHISSIAHTSISLELLIVECGQQIVDNHHPWQHPTTYWFCIPSPVTYATTREHLHCSLLTIITHDNIQQLIDFLFHRPLHMQQHMDAFIFLCWHQPILNTKSLNFCTPLLSQCATLDHTSHGWQSLFYTIAPTSHGWQSLFYTIAVTITVHNPGNGNHNGWNRYISIRVFWIIQRNFARLLR